VSFFYLFDDNQQAAILERFRVINRYIAACLDAWLRGSTGDFSELYGQLCLGLKAEIRAGNRHDGGSP
jgi:hypothetical protein